MHAEGACEMSKKLLKRYPVECSECGHEFYAAPSLSMHLGQNSGHGSCTKCKTFLHLEIDPSGDEMTSMPHVQYIQKCKDQDEI